MAVIFPSDFVLTVSFFSFAITALATLLHVDGLMIMKATRLR